MLTSEDLIIAEPGSLNQGLFGGIFLYVFSVLPYLRENLIFPNWSISSTLYGQSPDYVVIPGLLDLNYVPPGISARSKSIPLATLLEDRCSVLGSDWTALSDLWKSYFRVPDRINERVGSFSQYRDALGIHYRANDKLTANWDSNPVSHADFTAVVVDFLHENSELKKLFVATDDAKFTPYIKASVDLEVLSFGSGKAHFEEKTDADRLREADRALIDCVALSRCKAVLATSSALSAFSKILNPELRIFRCAASKLFADIPYFPIAYVPIYVSKKPEVQQLIATMVSGDWTFDRKAKQFQNRFSYRKRKKSFRDSIKYRLRKVIIKI